MSLKRAALWAQRGMCILHKKIVGFPENDCTGFNRRWIPWVLLASCQTNNHPLPVSVLGCPVLGQCMECCLAGHVQLGSRDSCALSPITVAWRIHPMPDPNVVENIQLCPTDCLQSTAEGSKYSYKDVVAHQYFTYDGCGDLIP